MMTIFILLSPNVILNDADGVGYSQLTMINISHLQSRKIHDDADADAYYDN